MIDTLLKIETWLSVRENMGKALLIVMVVIPFIAYTYDLARVKVLDYLFFKELLNKELFIKYNIISILSKIS